jgi:hypothetical protein
MLTVILYTLVHHVVAGVVNLLNRRQDQAAGPPVPAAPAPAAVTPAAPAYARSVPLPAATH